MPKHNLWGYEVPLPASDIYTALLAVGLFLPTVVILHNVVAFLLRQVRRTSTRGTSKTHQT